VEFGSTGALRPVDIGKVVFQLDSVRNLHSRLICDRRQFFKPKSLSIRHFSLKD
jgi:hypothetical protein